MRPQANVRCMRAQELKGYLRKGISLDELWRVARGEVKYGDFASTQQDGSAAVAPPPPSVPDELARPLIPLLEQQKALPQWCVDACCVKRATYSSNAKICTFSAEELTMQ